LDLEDQDAADEDNAGTALYAAHQTTVYSAPPVVNGRIPKNVYGNLDVYVPSMVPLGGVHVPHPETARAAKIIGIDYADAVTGFLFKGRHGTAVTKGAVVAVEYREAVEEVIKAFEDDRARAEEERKSLEALRMWKRMLAGLRIMERIEGYDVEGERGERQAAMQEELERADQEDDEGEGGGFLPDRDAEVDVQPTAGSIPAKGWANMVDDVSGGFVPENEVGELPVQYEVDPTRPRDPFIDNLEDDDGGGFLVNDADADAEEALQEINAKDEKTPYHIDEDDQEDTPQGAGYLPDGDVTVSEPNSNGPALELTTVSTKDHTPPPAVPDLPDDELEEAVMLQQLYETSDVAQSPDVTQDAATPSPDDGPAELKPRDLPAESTTTLPPLMSHPSTTFPSPPENEDVRERSIKSESSGDEKGSLLSHDPDDEDADPEWLT